MKKRKRPTLRAFIAAPANLSLRVLREELDKRNVEAYTAHELAFSSTSFADSVSDGIKRADFIIAVVPNRDSPSVFWELGAAWVIEKPRLVLLSPTVRDLPFDVADLFCLRIDPENRLALSFALDHWLEHIGKPLPRPTKAPRKSPPLGEEVSRYLSAIQGRNLPETELEALIAELLRKAGAEAVVERRWPDAGADIVIWSDGLQVDLGNPIIVEVVKSIRSHREFQQALEKLERNRQKSASKLALLLIETVALAGGMGVMSPTVSHLVGVLPVLITDLLEKLRTRTLADTITDLRNAWAHSGGR